MGVDSAFDAAACRKIGRNPSPALKLGFSSHTSDASHGISQGIEKVNLVLNQTLTISVVEEI